MQRSLRARLDKLEPKARKALREVTVLHVRSAHFDDDRVMLLQALADIGKPYPEGDPLIVITTLGHPCAERGGVDHLEGMS
jgi:hypothetical protein